MTLRVGISLLSVFFLFLFQNQRSRAASFHQVAQTEKPNTYNLYVRSNQSLENITMSDDAKYQTTKNFYVYTAPLAKYRLPMMVLENAKHIWINAFNLVESMSQSIFIYVDLLILSVFLALLVLLCYLYKAMFRAVCWFGE